MIGWYLRVLHLFLYILLVVLLPYIAYQTTSSSGTLQFALCILLSLFPVVLIRKWNVEREGKPRTLEELRKSASHFEGIKPNEFKLRVRDGYILSGISIGSGPKVILCGNGLGCSSVFAIPLLRQFQGIAILEECTIVSWDYRGLFESAKGTEGMKSPFFSVRDSAEDAIEVLDHLGVKKPVHFIGYSTGVQVGLQLASMYPERVEKLGELRCTRQHEEEHKKS